MEREIEWGIGKARGGRGVVKEREGEKERGESRGIREESGVIGERERWVRGNING